MRNEAFETQPVFVGHTRFSVHQYGSGNFVATREDARGAGFNLEEYTEWLYSRKRLQPRVEIFTRIGVPQLALAARDYNVVHYVSYSASLPDDYKRALRSVAQENAFIQLNQVEGPIGAAPTTPMIKAALNSFNLPEDSPVGVYRQDDDDVLAANYFSRMASYVKPEFAGFWVSLGLGVAALKSDAEFIYAREWYYPKIAIGLMHVVSPYTVRKDRGNHSTVDFKAPTILDSREPGWFHIRHPGQDTNLSNKVGAFFPKNFRKIAGRGGADPEQLSDLFPAFRGRVYTSPGHPEKAKHLTDEPLKWSGRTSKFGLDTTGPVAVRVIPESSQSSFDQVKLHFTLHLPSDREQSEIQRELKKQGIKYSAQTNSYFVSFLTERSSSELVAVLEFPWNIYITEMWLASSGSTTFAVERISVYPLSDLD